MVGTVSRCRKCGEMGYESLVCSCQEDDKDARIEALEKAHRMVAHELRGTKVSPHRIVRALLVIQRALAGEVDK